VALAAPGSGPRMHRREVGARLAEVAEAIGLDVDLAAPLRTLPIAQQQQVEIAKVLVAGARILILDEPTSVLAPQEVDGLFAQMDELRARGLDTLPTNLLDATIELERDDVIREALGEGRNEDYVDYFIKVKREEWNRYHEQVTPWEIKEYLTRF